MTSFWGKIGFLETVRLVVLKEGDGVVLVASTIEGGIFRQVSVLIFEV